MYMYIYIYIYIYIYCIERDSGSSNLSTLCTLECKQHVILNGCNQLHQLP